MVASQLVLVNHFFLALVHNTPDPATVPDFNSVVVDAGCNRGCRLCSPVNGCLSCEPPFFLVLQRDGVRQTASCTKTCPQGFFKVKKKRNGFCSKCTMLGCEECLGPHYCSTCQQHYFNYFGRCIRETPGKNKTEKLGITTEHTLMAEEVEKKYENEDETKTEEEEKEKEEGGIQIMLTSLHRPTTTTTATATIHNTTLPSPTLTPTPRPSPSPLPSVPTPTTSPPSPSSDRERGRLRPCRRRHRRRRKHKHGRKETEKLNRRKNRNKERRKDVINRRRQCRRRGRGGRGGRRGRRKGKRWGGRRREKERKTTTTTITNVTTTSTTITITTEIPTTTQMIDLSLLGEEGQMGNSNLAGSSTQLDGHKFFYNNQPREMARFKQSNAYRRKKPAYVKGKRVRHAKLG